MPRNFSARWRASVALLQRAMVVEVCIQNGRGLLGERVVIRARRVFIYSVWAVAVETVNLAAPACLLELVSCNQVAVKMVQP